MTLRLECSFNSEENRSRSRPTTAADYFLSSLNHTANDMILIPIEKIFSNRDSIRKARKAFLIQKFFHLILIFSLHCQLFLLISGYYTICNVKITYQCKIIIVPEEGWFGQPKYSTPTKKSFYVVSTSASIFFILYVKPIRSLLIQRTPAGSSFRLFA